MAGPLRGEEVKGRAIKEKIIFWEPFFPTFQHSNGHKARGGGGGG